MERVDNGFTIGYGIAATLMVVAMGVFFLGSKRYKKTSPLDQKFWKQQIRLGVESREKFVHVPSDLPTKESPSVAKRSNLSTLPWTRMAWRRKRTRMTQLTGSSVLREHGAVHSPFRQREMPIKCGDCYLSSLRSSDSV